MGWGVQLIVTRFQLYCDGEHGVPIYFPEDGAVDGAILTHGEVRQEAKQQGWGRKADHGGYVDLCPTCNAAHRQERLKRIREKSDAGH
jgi:hypothetical protein